MWCPTARAGERHTWFKTPRQGLLVSCVHVTHASYRIRYCCQTVRRFTAHAHCCSVCSSQLHVRVVHIIWAPVIMQICHGWPARTYICDICVVHLNSWAGAQQRSAVKSLNTTDTFLGAPAPARPCTHINHTCRLAHRLWAVPKVTAACAGTDNYKYTTPLYI